jgi:hypothetical protein
LTPTGKKLQDGTRAVARQIANDILPNFAKAARPGGAAGGFPSGLPRTPPTPPNAASLEKVGSRLLNILSNQVQTGIRNLQDDLSDPLNKIPQRVTRQTEEFVQEAKNIFLETPEGLQGPAYSVVEKCDLYEIRDYEAYTVAATAMQKTEDLATAGTAFNTLAEYLFGANEDNRSMEMTTPVATTSSGEMRFFLAGNNIPQPLDASVESQSGKVQIVNIPPARLAVRKFTGFTTDGEVARQKDTLFSALEMDGVELDVAHGAVVPYVVFQYNPPYTLPIVRRNEIAVPVLRGMVDQLEDLRKEWNVDVTEDEVEVVSSWSSESETEMVEPNNLNSVDSTERPEDDISPSD